MHSSVRLIPFVVSVEADVGVSTFFVECLRQTTFEIRLSVVFIVVRYGN